ncbi:MAG: choice-of-anchor D domain-containing protein, partial [Terracidiphilus sp.]
MSDRGWNVTTKFNNAVLLSLAAMLCLFSSAIARAQLTVTATSVNFGNVVVDQTSGSKSITVQNGGASATFSQVSVNLTPPYAISPSSTCASGVTLAHKGICTITLTATPSVIGAMPAGTLTLASNASNSPQEISLSGTGIGVAQTITFSNPGTQTAGTPLPLIATATSGLTVAFTSATTSVCTVSGTTA